MVELAWSWLRHQPESELTQWFKRRFAGGADVRGASALWRSPGASIALWRYLEDGLIPAGATLKPIAG